jgi:hypothetical protein
MNNNNNKEEEEETVVCAEEDEQDVALAQVIAAIKLEEEELAAAEAAVRASHKLPTFDEYQKTHPGATMFQYLDYRAALDKQQKQKQKTAAAVPAPKPKMMAYTVSSSSGKEKESNGELPPLQLMVHAKTGDVAMSRQPLTLEEWTKTLLAMANDLNARFLCDPMWTDSVRSAFQQWEECASQARAILASPLASDATKQAAVAERDALMCDLFRHYYSYVSERAGALMSSHYRVARADPVLGSTCKQLKPHMVTPVGCGDRHAVMLCNTESRPRRFQLLYALLTGAEVVTHDDVTKRYGALQADDHAPHECWPRYQTASGFVLDNVQEIRFASIYKQLVVVCYIQVGAMSLTVAIGSLANPSTPVTIVQLDWLLAATSWRVACNGRFLVVAHNNGTALDDSTPPTALQVLMLDTRGATKCFPFSFDAVDDDQVTPLVGRDAIITSLCFDVNHDRENYLCLSTADRRALTFELLLPQDNEPVPAYQARASAHAVRSVLMTQTTPTAARELDLIQASPQKHQNSMREPPTNISTAPGHRSRLLIVTPNNFTVKTLLGFEAQPTISEHYASFDNLPLGTLPILHQHGAGMVQSMACAGNLLLVHFVENNNVVLVNMRDQTIMNSFHGSAIMGYVPPDDEVDSIPGDTPEEDEARRAAAAERRANAVDPFRPPCYYQSTWACLGRAAVMMSNGTLLVFEPLLGAAPSKPRAK